MMSDLDRLHDWANTYRDSGHRARTHDAYKRIMWAFDTIGLSHAAKFDSAHDAKLWCIENLSTTRSRDFHIVGESDIFSQVVLPVWMLLIYGGCCKICVPNTNTAIANFAYNLSLQCLSAINPDLTKTLHYCLAYDTSDVAQSQFVIISQTYHRDNPAESDRIAKLDKIVFRFIEAA